MVYVRMEATERSRRRSGEASIRGRRSSLQLLFEELNRAFSAECTHRFVVTPF